MKFTMKHLADLPRCYAAAEISRCGRQYYAFASELDAPCYLFDAETLERETVWEHPGGTMAIIPLNDRDGEFLAVQNFKPKMMAPNTEIVWVRPDGKNGWEISTLAKQGYIHRFDVLHGDRDYLIVCTIASNKTCLEDWSSPGKIWAAPLPNDLNRQIELHEIRAGMTKNHGYCRVKWNGIEAGAVSSEEGVIIVTPPQSDGDHWHFEPIISRPISDIAFIDIDGDGELEMAAIEPFHGNLFTVNKRISGRWETIYTYPGDFKVGHAICAGTLCGKPSFIGGSREGAGDLFAIQCSDSDPQKLECTLIDSGRGPANARIVNRPDGDLLLVSNRELGEAALYRVSE